MAKEKFTVLREHWGDKEEKQGDSVVTKRHRYAKGDTRMADPETVAAEVHRKILAPATEAAKAAVAVAGGDKLGN